MGFNSAFKGLKKAHDSFRREVLYNIPINLALISNLMHKILIYFTYNTFIKILYMFRALPAHFQEVYVVILYMQPLVSSLSAGDCLVHWLRKNNYDVDLLKMSR